MIRSYKCIDNPQKPISYDILLNPNKMAAYARGEKFISLPLLPMISLCLGVEFENGLKANPIFEKIQDVKLEMDYEKEEYKTMVKAIEIIDDKKTVIEMRGPLAILDNLLGIEKIMRAMRKNRENLNFLYDEFIEIYLEYIKKMLDMGITIFSFAESILDIKLFGPREVGNYVNDFLLKFLKEIRILQKENPFTFHLCPKSSLILVDLAKADFFPIEYEGPKKYIDILYENKCFLGDRCLNLADKKFKSVNKIILKEE